MTSDELSALIDGISAADMRALARACRLIDERDPRTLALLKRIFSHDGHAYVIGVTGTPGAGKSTLVDGLIQHCLLYTSPSPRDQRGSRMPSSA